MYCCVEQAAVESLGEDDAEEYDYDRLSEGLFVVAQRRLEKSVDMLVLRDYREDELFLGGLCAWLYVGDCLWSHAL